MPRSGPCRGAGDLRVPWRVAGAVLALTSLSYLNCLGCGFVFDDVSAIKENRDLRPSSPVTQGLFCSLRVLCGIGVPGNRI